MKKGNLSSAGVDVWVCCNSPCKKSLIVIESCKAYDEESLSR